ncbi:LOW QUALITY PROTEIN: cysteine-rich repeat secretory protein 15 [Sesamum indicum]|uniref:LOW QUALITY PROTEIN: cysteine-rich repeat secretory protein 15 n=1 Tax=Sesamum indicum TaxID=4182 RepID=A0A6I9U945_SESIN|nr:LOW QUALITY PROTEIN: cysteine-rich repeat secretory protein 15 [Sesamum indicum]
MLAPSSLTLLLFILLITSIHGHLAQARIFIYASCSQDKYQPSSPYETNLNSLLSSIVSSSSQTLYNMFAVGNDTTSVPPDSAVYGLYQCRGDLKPRDCSTCIAGLIDQIELLSVHHTCPYTYGASLQLDGCFVTYVNTDFLGKLDDSLRFKKCSGNGGNDGEFLRRRDDVLADLQGAVGFRVAAAGAVEGYAQCLGDLEAADCSACLADAVMKVKSLCGSAAAGDVFLGQCYVRYWESGYYDSSSDSSNHDDVGKTVAIILGVVAGVAVLIVTLAFCKKALG